MWGQGGSRGELSWPAAGRLLVVPSHVGTGGETDRDRGRGRTLVSAHKGTNPIPPSTPS